MLDSSTSTARGPKSFGPSSAGTINKLMGYLSEFKPDKPLMMSASETTAVEAAAMVSAIKTTRMMADVKAAGMMSAVAAIRVRVAGVSMMARIVVSAAMVGRMVWD